MYPATIENLDHKWPQQATPQTRRLKVILPQCYAVLAILAVNLSYVTFETTTFQVTIDLDSKSTYITYDSMTCIGLLLGGIIAHLTGARLIVMLASVVSIAGWIALGWTTSLEFPQWIIYIVALAKGMIQGPSYVYLAEISQPNMRNTLMAVMCLTVKDRLADLFAVLYANLMSGGPSIIAILANVVFAVFGLVVMFFLPDSPYWLANKGRYGGVESSLAWFRGRTSVENVKSESKSIISNTKDSPSACKLFCHRSIYIAALIVGCVFLVTAFTRILYLAYLLHPGAQLRNATFLNTGLAWDISSVFITISFVVLVTFIEKKVMVLIFWFCGNVAILVALNAEYLKEFNILSNDVYLWFLIICEAVAYFSLITGAISIPLMLNGELFPSKLRNFGAGFGLFFAYLVNVGSNHLYAKYFPFSENIKWPLVLGSVVGFISLIWLFPRNENKNLLEIERSCKSVRDLNRKK